MQSFVNCLTKKLIVFHMASLKTQKIAQLSMSKQRNQYGLIYNNDVSCFRASRRASKASFRRPIIHLNMGGSTQLNAKEFYEPKLYQFYIAINAVETRFLTIHFQSHDRHRRNQSQLPKSLSSHAIVADQYLNIYFISLKHKLKQNLIFINPC